MNDGIFGARGDFVAWTVSLFEEEAARVGEILASTEFAETRTAEIVFNIMDVSIIRLLPDIPYVPTLPGDLSGLQIGDSVSPEIGDEVFKVGAATGITEGKIIQTGMRLSLPRAYGNPTWMKGVFEIAGSDGKLFSNRGDSGSIIFKRRNDLVVDVVGMIFGSAGLTTYAFPVRPVLDSFRCRLFAGARKKQG